MLNTTRNWRVASALVGAVFLSACQPGQENMAGGATIGGLLGGLGCAALGGSAGECIAAGVAGAVIGGAIGAAIDERDRQYRQAALQQTLNDDIVWNRVQQGQQAAPVSWSGQQTGNTGRFIPLRTFADTSGGQAQTCRVMQESYTRDGRVIDQQTTMCQNPRTGEWEERTA